MDCGVGYVAGFGTDLAVFVFAAGEGDFIDCFRGESRKGLGAGLGGASFGVGHVRG